MAKRGADGPSGLLLIDKEAGWTSHDVVAKARGLCRQRRIGHTGTLDPAATGLLVLCLGRATRLVEYLTDHDKAYVGEVALGATTDTDDAEGTVIETRPVPSVGAAELAELEARFTGDVLQRPPAYSAVKVQGERAYAIARRGGELELSPRPVRIERLRLVPAGPSRLRLEVECGPGTYVRSLARDIGAALGCGGHLAWLRRTRVGQFHVAQAVTLAELAAFCEGGRLDDLRRAPDEGLADRPAAIVGEATASAVRTGAVVRVTARRQAGLVRVYDGRGCFIGTGMLDAAGMLRTVKVLESR